MESRKVHKFFAVAFGLIALLDLYQGNYIMAAVDLVLMSMSIYYVRKDASKNGQD